MGLVAKYDLAPDRLVSGERFSGNLVEHGGVKWEVGVHASQVRRVYGGCCVGATARGSRSCPTARSVAGGFGLFAVRSLS